MNILSTLTNFVLGVVVSGLSLVGIQTPFTPPTLTLTANPAAISLTGSSVISWSTPDADTCISKEFDTGNAVSGSVTVYPTQTTTYSVTCSKTQTPSTSQNNTGVWRQSYKDITDLWCTSQQPSFKNYYTNNPCPSNNPDGQSCSPVQSDCAVNSWQTKGGGVGAIGSKLNCNLLTTVYTCVASNGTVSNSPAVGGSNTVYSGDFGNIVAPHLQYRSMLQSDVDANGGPFVMDGFYDDKATADHICAVLFPGSTNSVYQNDRYKSPKNNTVLRWNGSRWVQQSATSHRTHLRYNFTCVAPVANQPTAAPSPITKKVTKSVTVIVANNNNNPAGNGQGGGINECTDGIDNDGDGKVDAADYGCSGNSQRESPNPQCSDGIDNNGDGNIDYPNDPACTGPTDNIEAFAAGVPLLSGPTVVQKNKKATLEWSVTNGKSGSCAITGTNGDSFPLSGTSGTVESSPLANETVFTLTCKDLNNHSVSSSLKVKIIPSYTEE